jgi:hypothetical protein
MKIIDTAKNNMVLVRRLNSHLSKEENFIVPKAYYDRFVSEVACYFNGFRLLTGDYADVILTEESVTIKSLILDKAESSYDYLMKLLHDESMNQELVDIGIVARIVGKLTIPDNSEQFDLEYCKKYFNGLYRFNIFLKRFEDALDLTDDLVSEISNALACEDSLYKDLENGRVASFLALSVEDEDEFGAVFNAYEGKFLDAANKFYLSSGNINIFIVIAACVAPEKREVLLECLKNTYEIQVESFLDSEIYKADKSQLSGILPDVLPSIIQLSPEDLGIIRSNLERGVVRNFYEMINHGRNYDEIFSVHKNNFLDAAYEFYKFSANHHIFRFIIACVPIADQENLSRYIENRYPDTNAYPIVFARNHEGGLLMSDKSLLAAALPDGKLFDELYDEVKELDGDIYYRMDSSVAGYETAPSFATDITDYIQASPVTSQEKQRRIEKVLPDFTKHKLCAVTKIDQQRHYFQLLGVRECLNLPLMSGSSEGEHMTWKGAAVSDAYYPSFVLHYQDKQDSGELENWEKSSLYMITFNQLDKINAKKFCISFEEKPHLDTMIDDVFKGFLACLLKEKSEENVDISRRLSEDLELANKLDAGYIKKISKDDLELIAKNIKESKEKFRFLFEYFDYLRILSNFSKRNGYPMNYLAEAIDEPKFSLYSDMLNMSKVGSSSIDSNFHIGKLVAGLILSIFCVYFSVTFFALEMLYASLACGVVGIFSTAYPMMPLLLPRSSASLGSTFKAAPLVSDGRLNQPNEDTPRGDPRG